MLVNRLVLAALTSSSVAFADNSLIDTVSYRGLASDHRAYRVGDLLTVIVMESTSAQSTAGTGATSDFNVSGNVSNGSMRHEIGAGIGGNSDSTGQTSRSGNVRTQMSVRVLEILPQQLIKIHGEQSLTVNGETQRIGISGIVRADDIGNDNIIISNRIADASIEIIGDGDVSNAQKQNVIYRALKWLGIL